MEQNHTASVQFKYHLIAFQRFLELYAVRHIESLSLLLSLYCLQRAHFAWTILGLLGIIAIIVWIAESIVGAFRVQPFAFPVPIFLIALWLGMFALSGALHVFGKRS